MKNQRDWRDWKKHWLKQICLLWAFVKSVFGMILLKSCWTLSQWQKPPIESEKERNVWKEKLLNQRKKILSFLPFSKQVNSWATTICKKNFDTASLFVQGSCSESLTFSLYKSLQNPQQINCKQRKMSCLKTIKWNINMQYELF